MSSPPISGSGGARRSRYSRSPSGGGIPPSKRSKPSNSADLGSSDHHRLYTSICVKNINPKIPDLEVRELCNKKFSKYGTNSVKIYYKNQERVAFVNFTNCEDAKKARHAKTGLVWENIQIVLEPVYYRRAVPAEQPLNPGGSPRDRSPPPSPKRRPRRPSPSPPPVSSRGHSSRHHHTSSPPRSRRHYSPYIPLPPDLIDYASTKSGRRRQGSSPSPPPRDHPRRRSRSRSMSTSPVPHKSRGKIDDNVPNRGGESNVQHDPTRTLFVGNLERDVRESKLKEVFGRYGTIEEIDLKVPQSSSKRAYAFIQYENMDMAYEARRAMDGHFIGKADCKIGYGKIVPTNCLWVGNIPIDMKRRDLEQAFTRYGQIKSFDFSNGDPTATVTYNEIEDAIKARAKLTGVTQIIDGRKVRTESGQSESARRAGFRIDYLDRPTARRFVIVRPQDNTAKRRGSRSSSASSASSTRSRSSKDRRRSVSNENQHENGTNKNFKRESQSRSPSPPAPPPPPPPPAKRRSPTPPPATPAAGRTFHGAFGSYLSVNDTANINNIGDLMKLCEKLNLSASKTNANLSTVYPVQFILKSHAYDARMHFIAGNPKLANILLGQPGDHTEDKTELKVTQRLRLDQHKLEDLEKKLRTSVTNASSNTNVNGQSTPTGGRKPTSVANQTKFVIMITSPNASNSTTQRKSNGKANSPTHPSSSDENDDRAHTKKDIEDDDESSLSRLISYLAVKEAAGVISIPFNPNSSNEKETAVLHIFPPCQLSKKILRIICPSIGFSNGPHTPPSRPSTMLNDEHLMVVIVQND